MNVTLHKTLKIDTFLNSGPDNLLDFIFTPILKANKTELSKHYAILIASPYLDGAAEALERLDAFLTINESSSFVVLLVDQHKWTKKPSPSVVSILKPKVPWKSVYGIICDTVNPPGIKAPTTKGYGYPLSMHCKLYCIYRYAPKWESVNKWNPDKEHLIRIISGGGILDGMNAFYEPVAACLGSANFTSDALLSSSQREIMLQCSDSAFVEMSRGFFIELLKGYTSPAFYKFGP